MSTKIPTLEEMLKSGVHFGHQASRWHPKMGAYIHTKRNGVHIIDLEKTQKALEQAATMIEEAVANGEQVLFLGTKAQMKSFVKDAAERAGQPHVTERWLGGTLTNFEEISKLIKRLHTLKRQRDTGELAKKYNKREQLTFTREIEDLEFRIGGIQNMAKLPAVVIVFDIRNEMTAVKEATRRNIPVIGMCDTNVNPAHVDVVIPANDDAVKSIELVTDVLAAAVLEGKKRQKALPKPAAAAKKPAIK